jgi:hypothetical protein
VIEDAAPPPPVELPPGAWEAPPVRNPAVAPPSSTTKLVQETTAAKKRRNKGLIGAVIGGLVLFSAAGGLGAWYLVVKSENHRAAEARKAYDEGFYAEAESRYRALLKDFPDSGQVDDYAFMADLCKVRKAPFEINPNPKTSLEDLGAFLDKYAKHPLMQEHLRDVGETYMKIVRELVFAKLGESSHPDPAMAEVLRLVLTTLALFEGELERGVLGPQRTEIAQKVAEFRVAVAKEEQRRKDLDLLAQLKPTIDGIRDCERLMRERRLVDDTDARTILEELYRKHRDTVQWTQVAVPLDEGVRKEDRDRVLLVDSKLDGNPPALARQEGVVLALVRGVLYGLRQADGAVQWAMRVGIDTTQLPVHIPPVGGSPELILVTSADTYTLTALDPSGREVWRYRLSAPSLGRPVIPEDPANPNLKNRAFISTFDGQIHEIELAKGQLLGRYTLGEGVKLSAGGVHMPRTNVIYFPADEFCFFAIDVEKHTCESILYTKHRSGALRGEPIISSWTERVNNENVPNGYLFLGLTEDLNSMRLDAYPLPIENGRAGPLAMNPTPRARGWAWFPWHRDFEKLIQLTDDGMLALLGVKQKRNEDNPLFPLLAPDPKQKGFGGVDVAPLLGLKPEDKVRGRALVVHMDEPDYFWVLAHGRLRRLQLLLTMKQGPTVRPAWKETRDLGAPLHVAQYFEYPFDQVGKPSPTLLLVTEPLTREMCMATAVDAETGNIRWQRQLGLVCRGEPLVREQNVLALDQGGGLFAFDVERFKGIQDEWPVGGRSVAQAIDDGETPPILVAGPDRKTAYEFAIPKTRPGTNSTLIVRRYQDQGGPVPLVQPRQRQLNDRLALAGNPAVSSAGILVPLSDGTILRFGLDGAFVGEGPSWKVDRDDPGTQAHVVWLNGEEFLATDGIRSINRWRWKAGAPTYFQVPAPVNRDEATIRMPANIVGEPLPLEGKGPGEVGALVACEDRTLYLIEGKKAEALKPGLQGLAITATWNARGKITAAPFFVRDFAAVIADRNRLLLFAPGKADPLWEYKSEGEAIVGQPQIVEDVLIVADQSGRYVGLDPVSGKPRGKGYKLQASAGPAASPVAFGPGQAFAPLTDGTILLLDLNSLRQ